MNKTIKTTLIAAAFVVVLFSALSFIGCGLFQGPNEPTKCLKYNKYVNYDGYYVNGFDLKQNEQQPKNLIIPDTYEDKPVVGITYEAFRNTQITNVTIPASIKEIGVAAFADCRLLEKITFAEDSQLVQIGDSAFANCEKLQEIAIPDGVSVVDNHLFEGCASLSKVTLAPYVERAHLNAFVGCDSLSELDLSACQTVIWDYSDSVFAHNEKVSFDTLILSSTANEWTNTWKGVTVNNLYYNGNMADWCKGFNYVDCNPKLCSESVFIDGVKVDDAVVIPDGVEKIGHYAFVGFKFKDITIGKDVKEIGASAFKDVGSAHTKLTYNGSISSWCAVNFKDEYSNPIRYCDRMYVDGKIVGDLVIPSDVKRVSNYAFNNYSRLDTITLSDGVEEVGLYAFYNCASVDAISLSPTLKKVGAYAFFNCKFTFSLTLPSSIEEMGLMAFCSIDDLYVLTVQDGITTIGDYAFSSCSKLKIVTLPSSVTDLGDWTFTMCDDLIKIKFLGTVEQWNLVKKGEHWKHNSGIAYVECSNGTVSA